MVQDAGMIGAASDLVIDTTTQTFMKDVIEASKQQPVLVDFWAPWCGPCKQLTPVIEKAVRAAKGKVKLAKMNIEEHPAIAGQMGIQSIPAVIAFANGQPIDGFMGAVPESQITEFIDRIGSGGGAVPQEDFIALADSALGEGQAGEAAQLYAQVLSQEPANVKALAGMARCYLATGSLEQAEAALAAVPDAQRNDAAVAAARAAIDVAAQAAKVGPLGELEKKVADNPADHQARFDLAIALNASGSREAAADHLLEIFKRARTWNEEAARKQLLQFFEAWGPADEATLSGRRRLSSMLFS